MSMELVAVIVLSLLLIVSVGIIYLLILGRVRDETVLNNHAKLLSAALDERAAMKEAVATRDGRLEEMREELRIRDVDHIALMRGHTFHIVGKEAVHADETKLQIRCNCGDQLHVSESVWRRLFAGVPEGEAEEVSY